MVIEYVEVILILLILPNLFHQVTCVMGDPIVPPKWEKTNSSSGSAVERIPEELVDQLHAQFLREMQTLFDKYKAAAGYPDAVLEVV